MKKALLALFAALMAISASAANQYESIPANGSTLSLSDYSGGIGSIEINCTGEINRNCTGFAILSRGKEVLKAIPASNTRMVYCVDGFDKVTSGTPHITFFSNAQNSPAIEAGDYTITIPSNFITVNGVGNNQLVYNFKIAGDNVKVDISPAKQSTIAKLTEIKLTYNGAETVSCSDPASIFMDYPDPANEDNLITVNATDAVCQGNVATIIFPEYDTPGVVTINIPSTAIKYTIPGQSGTHTKGEQIFTYTIAPAVGDGQFSLTPSTGTYSGSLKPYETEEIPSEYEGQDPTIRNYYFKLSVPEGYKFGSLASRKTGLQIEQANGTLQATSNYFNSWTINEEKTEARLYLTGEDTKELKLASGTYYLVIPKNSFQVYAPGAVVATMYSEELKFGPFIVEGEPIKYTVSPAANEAITELSKITISFPADSNVELNPRGWFTLMDGAIEYDFRGDVNGTDVIIEINPPMTTTGVYKLYSTDEKEGANCIVNGMETPVEAEFTVVRSLINEVSLISNDKPVVATIVDDPDYDGKFWAATISTPNLETNVASVRFELPYGYESVYAMVYGADQEGARRRVSVEEIEAAGMKKLANNTLSDLTVGQHSLAFTYVDADGVALEPSMMIINVEQSTVSGLPTIENISFVCDDKTIEAIYDEEFEAWTADVATANKDAENVTLVFNTPADYKEVYLADVNIGFSSRRRVAVEELEGFEKLADNTLVDLKVGTYRYGFTFANGDVALEPVLLVINVIQSEDDQPGSGIEAVEAAEDAEYFTLQGVKVVNPEKGIYIKVVNGKATKVTVK